jgi:hypothetical protein
MFSLRFLNRRHKNNNNNDTNKERSLEQVAAKEKLAESGTPRNIL